jgi:hypothetical protein
MQKLSLISVQPEPLPSFSETIGDLESFMTLLYQALEAGAVICRRYYDELCGGESPEAYLREMVVRGQAKRYLKENGLHVKSIKERGFSLASEPLLSLLVHHRGYAIRVLKAKHGIAPGCGKSKRRRDFYNQVSVAYVGDDGKPAHSNTNLLVFWDFSPKFGIASVWLACPEVAGSRSQDVVLAWQELMPSPVVKAAQPQMGKAESLEREARADEEIEALLLGADSPKSTEAQVRGPLHNEQALLKPENSQPDQDKGADDRQSH